MRPTQLLLVGAQVAGQTALLITVPVLTRAYSPNVLGIYQIGLALGLLLQPLVTLRVEFVLPSLLSDREAKRLLRGALLRIAVAAFFLLVIAVIRGISTPFSESLIIATAVLVAYSLTGLDNAVLIRVAQPRRLAIRNFLVGFLTAAFQLITVFTVQSVALLGLALLLGRITAVALTKRRCSATSGVDLASQPEWSVTRGVRASAAGLAAIGTDQSLRLMTGSVLGTGAAGLVGVAQQVASSPLGLIGAGLSQAVQAELAPLVRTSRPQLYSAVWRQLMVLLPVALIVASSMIVFGPSLAGPILGSAWAEVGTVVAILGVPTGLQIMAAPLMAVFPMLLLEGALLRLQSLRFGLALLGLLSGLVVGGNEVTALMIGHAIGNSVGYCVMLACLLFKVRCYDARFESN